MAMPELATGTTIAFGTTGFSATVTRGTLGAASRPAVRTTPLNPSIPAINQEGGHTSKPGKVHELGDLDLEIQWNPATGSRPPVHADPETVTITFPDGSTLSGTGYIRERGAITMEVDGLLVCTIAVARSGIWS